MRIKRVDNNFVIAQVGAGEYWNSTDQPVSALFPHYMYVMAERQAHGVSNGIDFEEALDTRIAVIVYRSLKQGHFIGPEKAEAMFAGDDEYPLTTAK